MFLDIMSAIIFLKCYVNLKMREIPTYTALDLAYTTLIHPPKTDKGAKKLC